MPSNRLLLLAAVLLLGGGLYRELGLDSGFAAEEAEPEAVSYELVEVWPGSAEARHRPAAAGASVREASPAVQAPPPAPAAMRGPIKFYATQWCGYCKQARAFFRQHGVSYIEYDIDASATARAEYEMLGGTGVPFMVIGGETVQGFNAQNMKRRLSLP